MTTITHEIKLPIGFTFRLIERETGNVVWAPQAFDFREWRSWPDAPEGIEYYVEDVKLPRNWDYTVGPACRVIRWDGARWEPTVDAAGWASAGWPVTTV